MGQESIPMHLIYGFFNPNEYRISSVKNDLKNCWFLIEIKFQRIEHFACLVGKIFFTNLTGKDLLKCDGKLMPC